MKRHAKLFGLLYQIAGHRLLVEDLTEGQKDRLTELLLSTLEDPDRLPVSVVRDLYTLAVKP